MISQASGRPPRTAFTIVELLVATAVMAIIATVLLTATSQATNVYRKTTGKIEQFGEARRAFESITLRVSEATLNTYWDYTYTTQGNNKLPSGYIRQSELRFRSGPMSKLTPGTSGIQPTHGIFFQAPAGCAEDAETLDVLDQTLNTWGYFLEVESDQEYIPKVLAGITPPRTRSRLLELREPTEQLSVYNQSAAATNDWFSRSIAPNGPRHVRVLAENIIALVVRPRLARADELARAGKPELSPKYEYDSTKTSNHTPALNPPDPEINPKNQLPPVVQIAMVAIDETSGAKLAESSSVAEDILGLTQDLFIEAAQLEDDPKTTKAGDGDLAILEERLVQQKLTYRIFNSTVPIRGAKWSTAQTN